MLACFPMVYLLLTLVIISHYFPTFKNTLTDNCKGWYKGAICVGHKISVGVSTLLPYASECGRLNVSFSRQKPPETGGGWEGEFFLYFTHNCSESCSAVIPGSKLYPPIHADIRVNRTVLDCWIFYVKKIDLFLFCIYKIAGFFLLEF